MVISQSPIKLDELGKLLCDELADLLHAENMLLKALPKLAAGACAPELKALFDTHFEETRSHVKRLEKMFAALDLPVREKKCEGMMGLLVECQHVLTRAKPSLAVDQALLCAARKIEAFESVAYRSIAAWAALCGYRSIADLATQAAAEEDLTNQAFQRMVPKISPPPALPSNATSSRKSKSREPVELLT